MSPLEQYQTHGLSSPISIRPSWKMHLLVWGGGVFLILGAVLALGADHLKTRFIGGFSVVFFGFALIVFASGLRLLKRTLDVGKGGPIDFGLKLVLHAADARGEFKKLQEQIEYARTKAASDPSAIMLNIPVPFRIGIAPQSLVAILNAEYAKHATALRTDA